MSMAKATVTGEREKRASAPRVIGVIPSRYASQRLPAKPLIDLLGKTMVQRVYEQARACRVLDRVIVATDDERIAQVIRSFGGEVMMTSSDITSGTDRVRAVAQLTEGDVFVNIQGDEPLMEPAVMEQAVRLVLDDRSVDVGTLAKRITDAEDLANPATVKVVMNRVGFALYFSRSAIPHLRGEPDLRRWFSSHAFYKHIGIYVFRRGFLSLYSSLAESTLENAERLEQLRILDHGYAIKVGITERDSVPVDTPEDVERVRTILSQSVGGRS
jgi:3-deoxy-manno-octulosonate cytidylyltransferase (CMP-KDO synthetase)